ncbi:MAG: MutS-related protein [Anaerolineales bacterium]
MKVLLLYPNRDFDPSQPLPPLTDDLEQDLGLDILFDAMAQGDHFLFLVARQVMLASQADPEVIAYRQEILNDCLQHAEVIRQIYQIPLEFLERKRKQWLWISPRHSSPSALLSSSRQLLESSLDLLRWLRQIADQYAEVFASQGLRRFLRMIQHELDDDYLNVVEQHIQMLRFSRGVLLRARLGEGNEGINYVLCRPNETNQNWLQHLFTSHSPSYSYTLHPRDDAGARVLSEMRDRGLTLTANAVAQAAEHVESFFNVLRWELAFYVGGLNLYERLTALGAPVAFPQPAPTDKHQFSCKGLYDASLALTMGKRIVGNDVSAERKSLVLITGPNQGGKTTFLRSVGLAQLMMQSGMFVTAESLSANLCTGLFTHFRREEDARMESGKFEEELKRMSTIVDALTPNALLLLNESFAATNEREGSEIAWQIIQALLKKGIKVFYVTHLYEFAHRCYEKEMEKAIFLCAERLADGTRTFKVKEAEPMETSYGMDLYREIFGVEGPQRMAG